MKRVIYAVITIGLALCPVAVYAVTAPLSDVQIEYIRNNCADTQIALRRIHATDGLAFVSLTEQYNVLSTRLMAPMNSRAAINNLNSVKLAKITADFNEQVKSFRSLYTTYEQTVTTAMNMACYNQPVEFYDDISSILDMRTKVRTTTDAINNLTTQYQAEVASLEQKVLGAS